MDERWVSIREIAEHIGVSKDTIYRWLSERAMPGHRIGKLWKFKKGEVDQWVEAGEAADKTYSSNSKL